MDGMDKEDLLGGEIWVLLVEYLGQSESYEKIEEVKTDKRKEGSRRVMY